MELALGKETPNNGVLCSSSFADGGDTILKAATTTEAGKGKDDDSLKCEV